MKLIYPIINIITVTIVSLLTFLSVVAVEKTVGLHSIYRMGDIEVLFFVLLYSGFIFNYLTKKFLEKNSDDKLSLALEHLSQSVGLYLISVFAFVLSVSGEGLENAYWFIIGLASVVGIVANFTTLKISMR